MRWAGSGPTEFSFDKKDSACLSSRSQRLWVTLAAAEKPSRRLAASTWRTWALRGPNGGLRTLLLHGLHAELLGARLLHGSEEMIDDIGSLISSLRLWVTLASAEKPS